MSSSTRRAHVIVPEELLAEVDALVGARRRSEFFVDAVREKVAREQLRIAAHRLAGSLTDSSIPAWETSDSSLAWVRSLREESDEQTPVDSSTT